MYCTIEDVKKKMSEEEIIYATTNGNEVATLEDNDVFNEAATEAADDIDTALGGRYDVPFSSPVPRTIKSIAVKLTIFYLIFNRFRNLDKLPEGVKLLKEYSDKKLDRISSGKDVLVIPLAPDDTEHVASSSPALVGEFRRSSFTNVKLRGM